METNHESMAVDPATNYAGGGPNDTEGKARIAICDGGVDGSLQHPYGNKVNILV